MALNEPTEVNPQMEVETAKKSTPDPITDDALASDEAETNLRELGLDKSLIQTLRNISEDYVNNPNSDKMKETLHALSSLLKLHQTSADKVKNVMRDNEELKKALNSTEKTKKMKAKEDIEKFVGWITNNLGDKTEGDREEVMRAGNDILESIPMDKMNAYRVLFKSARAASKRSSNALGIEKTLAFKRERDESKIREDDRWKDALSTITSLGGKKYRTDPPPSRFISHYKAETVVKNDTSPWSNIQDFLYKASNGLDQLSYTERK